MKKNILVPVDGSTLSSGLVSNAVTYAKETDAKLIFFHAAADLAGSGDGALMLAIDPNSFAERLEGRSRMVLAKASMAADFKDVDNFSVCMVSDRPYEAILKAAAQQHCDLIYMASHGRHGLSRIMVGSQTLKVISHATIPVYIDTAESNSPRPSMKKTLATIQSEHRTLGVVLRGLQRLIKESKSHHELPDKRLLRVLTNYMGEFLLKLHHPSGGQCFFDKLKQRTSTVDNVLTELEQQHQQNAAMITTANNAFDEYEKGIEDGESRFIQTLETYIQYLWNYLLKVEKEIVPEACVHLLDSDWEEIAHTYESNVDPLFDVNSNENIQGLLSRILYRINRVEYTSKV